MGGSFFKSAKVGYGVLQHNFCNNIQFLINKNLSVLSFLNLEPDEKHVLPIARSKVDERDQNFIVFELSKTFSV